MSDDSFVTRANAAKPRTVWFKPSFWRCALVGLLGSVRIILVIWAVYGAIQIYTFAKYGYVDWSAEWLTFPIITTVLWPLSVVIDARRVAAEDCIAVTTSAIEWYSRGQWLRILLSELERPANSSLKWRERLGAVERLRSTGGEKTIVVGREYSRRDVRAMLAAAGLNSSQADSSPVA